MFPAISNLRIIKTKNMKFSKLFLAFFLGTITVSAQTYTYMPDDNFESFCEANGYGDGILDNDTIDGYNSIALQITNLNIDNEEISDLTGLDAFVNLTTLTCSGNNLSSIDLSIFSNNLNTFNAINNNNDLYCIEVADTSYAFAQANFTVDSLTSYSTDCYTAFGCSDTAACNYSPTASIDTLGVFGSCFYNTDTIFASENVCDQYTWGFNNITYFNSGIYIDTILGSNGCDSVGHLNLTIRNSSVSITYDTICDNLNWNGFNVVGNGEYKFTVPGGNSVGCDTTAILHAVVNQSTTSTSTVTECDSYTWNGQTYTTSGTRTFATTNSNGCDSTATLNLTINPSTVSSTDITVCDTYTWNGQTYTVNGTYTFVTTNTDGCDSTATLNLTITNSTTSIDTKVECDTYTWLDGTTYTSSNNTATWTTTNAAGCINTATLDLTINNSTTSVDNVGTHCDSYTWNGQVYTASTSTETYTTTNANNCDSTVTLNLIINYSSSGDTAITTCDIYIDATGNPHTSTGLYTFILSNAVGCDSTVSLDLTVNHYDSSLTSLAVCDSVTWNNVFYDFSGTYYYPTSTVNGCDSVAELNLVVSPTYTYATNVDTVYTCDTYEWLDANGVRIIGEIFGATNPQDSGLYGNVGIYEDHKSYNSVDGCDSTVYLYLDLTQNIVSSNSPVVIRQCDPFTLNGVTYGLGTDMTGVPLITGTTANGCDSIGRYSIYIASLKGDTSVITECDDYTWLVDNLTYTSSDTISFVHQVYYYDSSGDSIMCDSTSYLFLTINYSTTSIDPQVACDSYTWLDGTTYTSSNNTATWLTTNAAGCTNTATLDLTINDSASFTIDTQVHCDNYTWINGTTYEVPVNGASTVFLADTMLTNSYGCDSLIKLHLTINPSYSDTLAPVIACDEYHWNIGIGGTGITYFTGGLKTAFFQTVHGCDSLILLDLTIDYNSITTESYIECDSFTWPQNGTTYYTSNNTDSVLHFTQIGQCDSIIYLDLTINYSTTSIDTKVECDTYTWLDGTTYTSSNNTATWTTTNAAGCINTATLDLTINNSTTSVDNVGTYCDSYTWLDGITYTASNNLATWTTLNSAGCINVATLNLDIDSTVVNRDTVTSCYNYAWIPDLRPNNIYTFDTTSTFSSSVNNTLTHVVFGNTVNTTECFDTSYLYLTINPLVDIDTSITSCDLYEWIHGDGSVSILDSSGTYFYTDTAITGCDSITTLNLTITNSTPNTDQVGTYCDSYTWIDGTTYTASNNTATMIYINDAGCDSIVTLDLTINYSSDSIITAVSCDSLYWSISDTTYYISGTHSYIVQGGNSVGCDSTVLLNLTINNSTTSTDIQVHCDSYTWLDGMTYTTSNSAATWTTTDPITGCDNLATLDLTINNSTTSTDSQIHCDTYTWLDGMTYITSNSTATWTTTDSITGCDNVATLDLTINNSTTSTDSQIHCDSYTWLDGLTYTSSNNSATMSYTNVSNCDSTVTLDLTINNSTTSTDIQVHCDSYTWLDGVTYTTSNNSATMSYTNVSNCDSTVTLDLTINNSTTSTDIQVHCDSYTWLDGVTYTTSNSTATWTTTGPITGCDNVATLDLTITNFTTSTDTQVACDTYTWLDGVTYTASNNTATFTSTNSAGCGNVATLDLTIDATGSTDSVDITACDDYTWDGVVYDSTGSYTNLYSDVNGCDSSVTLNLTIATGSAGSVNITDCEDFTWDGIVYDSTGSYTNVYIDVNGCDSLMTLNLTIDATGSTDSVDITACDDYTWDGILYDSTGSYTNIYIDSNGCDSVVTLNLTISTAESSIDNVGSHCDSYTWIDGVTYTTSNSIATMDYVNSAGCDSIVTLNLIVNDNPVVSISSSNNILSAIAIGGTSPYSYLWTGAINSTNAIVTPTASGDYCVQVTDDNGCVSTEVCENVIISTLNELDISKFNIYPNPTSDFINLDFNTVIKADYTVKIISSNGDQVYEHRILDFNGDYTKNINLSNLAKGNYIIQIHSDDQVVYRKILLQ